MDIIVKIMCIDEVTGLKKLIFVMRPKIAVVNKKNISSVDWILKLLCL
ncbi:hypothetical protein M5V91_29320 (plasmid) [Cytobacillus pseudoceanisediminis]|nr:hypothetical protein [Cytobacillus pseudoceanisediminis]UQX56926.1 hypothetical protein M5V91_29320 [Cytobacillus pseudoceanisediminis]